MAKWFFLQKITLYFGSFPLMMAPPTNHGSSP